MSLDNATTDAPVDLTKVDPITEPIAIVPPAVEPIPVTKPQRFDHAKVLAWTGLVFLGTAALMLLVTYAYALFHPVLTVDLLIATAVRFVTETPILFGVVIGVVLSVGVRDIKDLTTLVLTPVYLTLVYIAIFTFIDVNEHVFGVGLVSVLMFFWVGSAYFFRAQLLKFAAKTLGLEVLKRFNPITIKAATVTKQYSSTTSDTVIQQDVNEFLSRKVEDNPEV